MKAFTTFAIAAAMIAATATASFAGNKMTAGTEDPYVEPVEPVVPQATGSLGGGALPIIAGVAAAAIIAAAVISDSDSSSTHSSNQESE